MRFQSNNEEVDADINLTPLIDVVFLLLIFFMVTTTFSREAEIKLKLPEATSAEQSSVEDKFVTIQISDIGQFAVQGPEEDAPRELINSSLDTLRKAIERAAGDLKEPIILIRADRLTPHEAVINAMDAARRLGFFQITFATGQPQ
ncbi:MAG: biopolymer transporter ExbD [Arenicellales bacterium]|jgi:biopolymer transport protein ExbD